MPRRDIQFIKGSYYHIYNRGAARQSIFRDDQDYRILLHKMKEILHKCQATLIAYCLLPNHYHWLVRQDGDIEARQVPKRVFGGYSQTFNLRHGRSGTLFEGPFEALLVESDEYLRRLCCYIHANPVKHGIAFAPELWPYSNFLDWIGQRDGTLLDKAFIDEHFPISGQYEAYFESYLKGKVALPRGLREYLAGL